MGKEGRIYDSHTTLNYESTHNFFDNRALKYNENNPYSVTMYQDNNPELVKERNRKEVECLLPFLELNEKSRVLDVACGIGRWSDAIKQDIEEYCGIDFGSGLIDIAKSRNKQKENRIFLSGNITNLNTILRINNRGKYNRVLVIGGLVYLNDIDVKNVLSQIVANSDENSIICVREPIGIKQRLTLKEFYSSELNDSYNAIYRTKKELMMIFEECFMLAGFTLTKADFLFHEDSLNNREETAQYYFIFKK